MPEFYNPSLVVFTCHGGIWKQKGKIIFSRSVENSVKQSGKFLSKLHQISLHFKPMAIVSIPKVTKLIWLNWENDYAAAFQLLLSASSINHTRIPLSHWNHFGFCFTTLTLLTALLLMGSYNIKLRHETQTSRHTRVALVINRGITI
jgi:hypothetical protein